MEKRHILTTLTAVALLSSSAMSHAFSLSDVASAFGGEKSDQVATQIAENPLTKALVSDLGVKPEQAAGGAGAAASVVRGIREVAWPGDDAIVIHNVGWSENHNSLIELIRLSACQVNGVHIVHHNL